MRRYFPTFIIAWGAGLLALCFALLLAAAQPAHSTEKAHGFYGGAGAGVARLGPIEVDEFRHDVLDNWTVEIIPVGYRWANGFALESFADYERHAFEGDGEFAPFAGRKVSAGILRVGACGVYEHNTVLTFDPFVRACFGAAYAGLDPHGYDALENGGEGWNFQTGDIGWGFKAGAGVAFDVTDSGSVRARLAYHYSGTDGISWTGGREHVDSLRSHSVTAAVLVAY